ncbi:FecR family protein [Maribellus sp. YY47]|uniref:FecR family protein n=1 Tax=Maribellus sp. YY47 TaxID=2929486 RepID=UPI0020016DA4|nr:FecR family protein [Maribellus sp. YY47]MCK3684468.1 FecR domain-containing protein [Maribellus sp. YY47]
MNQKKINVIRRFFSKSYSDDDLKSLFQWLNSEKGTWEITETLNENWKSFEWDDNPASIESAKMLMNIKNGILNRKTLQFRNRVIKLLPYAAVFLVILGFIIILTSQGKINNNQYTSVITENGQRTKVVLPDSSIVWLNSGTTLSYNYSQKDRRSIILKGQGFFQVKRNESKPFVVQCDEIKVTVLGTTFDVNNYPENKKIFVVLESGSVELNHNNTNYILKPGEIADYDEKNKSISINDADIQKYISWKDGKLIFRNDPMELVIKELERWYNIKIIVKDPEVYNSIFTGTVINKDYSRIFKLIEYSCPVHCEVMNNTAPEEIPIVIITKK